MKRAMIAMFLLGACVDGHEPTLDAKQQESQEDTDRCGSFPVPQGPIHIEFKDDGTVVMPRETWDIVLGRVVDLEHYAFCLAVPPQE